MSEVSEVAAQQSTESARLSGQRASEILSRSQRVAIRAGGLVLAGLAIATPLSFEHALENTSVEDTIAGFPTTLSYTHQGGSQLDLGLPGRIYIPEDDRGIGISATVKDLPYDKKSGLLSIFSADYAAKLAGLYNDPSEAASGPVSALAHARNEKFMKYELYYGSIAAGALLLGSAACKREKERSSDSEALKIKLIAGASLAVLAVGPSVFAYQNFQNWQGNNPPISDVRLPISRLEGTALSDITVSNQALQFAIDKATDKIKLLLKRQDARQQAFMSKAETDLSDQSYKIHRPDANEIMFAVGSDMHDNQAMTTLTKKTISMINELYGDGTLNLMIFAGDQGYGESLEKRYIDEQSGIARHIVVSPGNHDTAIAQQNMDDAGMLRIKDKPISVEGLTVSGGEDPNVTPFGGTTIPRNKNDRGKDVEKIFGESVYQQDQVEGTNATALHEGYAAGAYLGIEDVTQRIMTDWFAERGSDTVAWEDGVRDLPTNLLVYGHWHRIIEPRTVWNSDGTWTLVMELNTVGGAIADPTINHFSTPNDAPGQTASFPIIYMNRETKLVTGYQMYTFQPSGETVIGDFVPIGNPGGQPSKISEGNSAKESTKANRTEDGPEPE